MEVTWRWEGEMHVRGASDFGRGARPLPISGITNSAAPHNESANPSELWAWSRGNLCTCTYGNDGQSWRPFPAPPLRLSVNAKAKVEKKEEENVEQVPRSVGLTDPVGLNGGSSRVVNLVPAVPLDLFPLCLALW